MGSIFKISWEANSKTFPITLSHHFTLFLLKKLSLSQSFIVHSSGSHLVMFHIFLSNRILMSHQYCYYVVLCY